jgi:hypothetical protein
MLYAAARRVDDKIWVRSTDIMMPNIHSITSVFEDGRSLKDNAPPWITIWTVPEDDHSSHQFVLCHLAEEDNSPMEARNRAMTVGQTPDRPYPDRQKVPGDYDAMTSQGSIARHTLEHLGTLDQGVVMFRRLLREGIRGVAAGRDPHGLSRGTEVLPTYGSDLVVPISAMAGNPNDPAALMQFARRTAADYLKSPPLRRRPLSKPVPLPARAAAE